MDNFFPQIEILSNQKHVNRPESGPEPWYKSRRLLVFTVVFLLSAILSLAYLYSRPALFRSYATLLTVAQTAIDQPSSDADIQHVAIQRQILTGQALLDETLNRMYRDLEQKNTAVSKPFAKELTAPELRRMLTVEAIPETNLVELAATGYQAEILFPLINNWIDVYLDRRAEGIRQTTGATIEALQEELAGLEETILIKRSDLEQFRNINDITSLGRENIFENQSLARFKGLNKSLSDASEEAIKTKARFDAVNKAIAEGKIVVPDEDKRGMRVLELRLQELREKLAEFDRKYTRSYLALQPTLNVLPKQIKDLEKEIQNKRHYGQSVVLSDAEQNFEAAQQALRETQKQLDEHKQEATEFSSRFAEHESLLSDLEGLELLQRSTKERLVQIEAKQAEKFPQVKVIERAFLPREPISPDYTRDAIIALFASIILALFCVWIVEFLTRKEQQKASVSISGVPMYQDSAPGLINNYQTVHEPLTQNPSQSLPHKHNNVLEQQFPREVSIEELDTLLENSDIKARQLISLLLSGLTVGEIARLKREHIDLNNKVISGIGESQRTISLNQFLTSLFENTEPCPAWHENQAVSEATLEAILVYAAVDAGLANANEITTACITHSYIMYLVKQGIRLAELQQIFGPMDPSILSKYSRYSPETRGLPISEINRVHPSLAI
ncbi:MAG: integrase [Gammaproteobacteria bacterium]|nr:integrase [Gammaproteobacteria bacterium]